MTTPASVADAIEGIGAAFLELAYALRKTPLTKEPEPTDQDDDQDDDLDDDVPFPKDEKVEKPKAEKAKEIKLADLQEIAAGLIKDGRRSVFLGILAKHSLKNLSSASKDLYPALWADLHALRSDD